MDITRCWHLTRSHSYFLLPASPGLRLRLHPSSMDTDAGDSHTPAFEMPDLAAATAGALSPCIDGPLCAPFAVWGVLVLLFVPC